ncbi:porin family protein [Hymenobacter sp. GOD-10R]|uniref:porin family protein n=1 Tax=Hymenobacter sp. GOD-10R TaxID=3093922 RepID=UPI002D76ACBA|nr:porin family protein [Hymenobacter sp. GOD-10R]WRQ28236.1 porin family protein [Hymenobacter sp. GOD-10R]
MKRLTLILPFLLLVFSAQAQFGVKVGVNEAVLNGENVNADTKYNTSYHAGIFYEFNVLGPLSIQPEVLYALNKSNWKSQFEDFDNKLNYFSVPVLAKVRVGPVFVEAGPQFSYLLKADKNGKIQVQGTSNTTNGGSATDDFKRGDFSLCAGAGLKLGYFLVGARFNAGINDINNVDNLSGVNDARLKNRVFQGYVALQLGK